MKLFKYLTFFLMFGQIFTIAQEVNPDELNTKIPELVEFHTTIYDLWHNAWPNKDIEKLKGLLPDIKDGFKKLKEVKLPGILRDKETAWLKNLDNFSAIIETYENAVNKDDHQAILDAAEKVHSQYETLVRTIRPVIPELDDFHKTLYVLYHYYLPEYNYDKIKEAVDTLLVKADKLNKAQLPKRLKSKDKEFNKARKELSSSVKDLKSVLKSKDKEKITKKIEFMHSKYQSVEAVFD